MAWRDYIVENLRWKLAALVLAVFAWFAIELSIWNDPARGLTKIVPGQTVAVLLVPGDSRTFRIDPPTVDVVLRSTAAGMRNLERQRLAVFVNLTEAPNVPGLTRVVLVNAADEVEVLRVEPKAVFVEPIGPNKQAAAAAQNKP